MAPALLLLGFANCGPAPLPPQKPKPDPTQDAGYRQAAEQLTALNREAETLFQAKRYDEAAARITQGQPLQSRLLAVPRPNLTATEAASDLDRMYGQMLFHNRHYGWALLQFQKNVTRWKNWKPQTPDTTRRLDQARAGVETCERAMEK